jgi:hypothetical protein
LPAAPCRRQLLAAPCRRQLLVHSPPPRRPRGGGAHRRGGGWGRAFAEPKTKRKWPAVPCAASTKRKRPAAGRSHCALASRRRRAEEEVHGRLCQTRRQNRGRYRPPAGHAKRRRAEDEDEDEGAGRAARRQAIHGGAYLSVLLNQEIPYLGATIEFPALQ